MKIKWRFSLRCGKRSFASELDAQLALVRTHRRAREGKLKPRERMEIRHYLCPVCKGWHLTSERQRSVPRDGRPT